MSLSLACSGSRTKMSPKVMRWSMRGWYDISTFRQSWLKSVAECTRIGKDMPCCCSMSSIMASAISLVPMPEKCVVSTISAEQLMRPWRYAMASRPRHLHATAMDSKPLVGQSKISA